MFLIYGWRARLGLIALTGTSVMESEFYKMVPEGVDVYVSRIFMSAKTTPETLIKVAEGIEKAAEELSAVDIDVIGYGCTSGSLIKGSKWNEEITKRMEEKSNVPAITTSSAVINALKEMKIKKVAVGTPYIDDINILEKKFLEENGFEVVNLKGLGILEISSMKHPPEIAYRLGKKVNKPEAEGIFLSCTNLRTIEIIEKLELDLRKPVITSNQATLWAMLKLANVHEPIHGYGNLLEKHF